MFRIRFHGRGGQGMKTASRILGTAFFLEGYEVQDAQRYGAERRGAPIFAYVRADRAPIQERGVITDPDLVVVGDDSLIPISAAGVTQGLGPDSVLLIDSPDTEQVWRDRLNLEGPMLVLERPRPLRPSDAPQVGAECAGAAAALIGVIRREALDEAVRRELAGMKEEVIEYNCRIVGAAYDRLVAHAGIVREGGVADYAERASPDWAELAAEGVERASATIFGGATSVAVRTGLWRSMRPVVDVERCRKCTWVCGSFCPDGAISRGDDGYPLVDLDHCKGCLICVAQCPPHAIEAVPEVECVAAEEAERHAEGGAR